MIILIQINNYLISINSPCFKFLSSIHNMILEATSLADGLELGSSPLETLMMFPLEMETVKVTNSLGLQMAPSTEYTSSPFFQVQLLLNYSSNLDCFYKIQ